MQEGALANFISKECLSNACLLFTLAVCMNRYVELMNAEKNCCLVLATCSYLT